MNANIVDLRYKMKEVLKALEKRESVKIFYHGKPHATIIPIENDFPSEKRVENHPFFGMLNTEESVEKTMDRLRGGRYVGL